MRRYVTDILTLLFSFRSRIGFPSTPDGAGREMGDTELRIFASLVRAGARLALWTFGAW